MKILILGFLAFSGWSTLSSYIYVCKIKGLCNEPVAMHIDKSEQNKIVTDNSLPVSIIQEHQAIPENLTTYFAFDKSEFNPDTKSDKYFDKSKAYLDKNTHARLIITGHTDATGTDSYNQSLGYRRARRMQQYFETKGMVAEKIIIESKGEKLPADNNNTGNGRANNRRTIITIKK